MNKEILNEPIFVTEIVEIIKSTLSRDSLKELLKNYHVHDIAQSLPFLSKAERIRLFRLSDTEWMSEIMSYVDNPIDYIDELGIHNMANVINEMDADDAVDLLNSLDFIN